MSTLKVDTIQTTGGASEIAIDKLKGVSAASSISVVGEGGSTTTNLQQGLIKQWVNLTAATPAYKTNGSFNASTITDEGVGRYEYPFTSPMENNDYSAVGCASVKGSENSYSFIVTTGDSADTYGLHSSASIRFNTYAYNATTLADPDTTNSMVSGDLA